MRCALAVAAAILLCAFAPAASKQAQHSKLNKLNVVALDAQGQPVTGLRSADFRLLEDGKAQDIAFFRFTGGWALQAKPGPREYSNRAGAAWHATVVLIDLLTDRIMSDAVIGREVSDSLKNLESSEGLYLYILTPRGELYPIHPLPKPDTEVTPAAEPWTRNIAPMLQAALKSLFGFKPVDDRDIKYRFDLTVNALRDLGSQMALLSGRKNLVWVTHGIPLVGFSISTQASLDFTNPLRWFCEELEQAQIVVYTVDQSMAGAGAAVGTFSAESLDEYTGITGGRGYSSDRAGDAIQQARTDSRANYEIAYYSASLKPDGKHHKIRVICGRKEVRLQTEHGFYAVAPGGPASSALRSRELPMEIETAAHSPFDATEIGLRASVSPDPANAQNMRFEIQIDAADLLPRPARNQGTGKVFVAFLAYDEGLQQASPPILVSLTPEQFAAVTHGEIGLREAIPVAPAIRKVRVIAFDSELGAVGSITIPILSSNF
jgi:VWFA-related protein